MQRLKNVCAMEGLHSNSSTLTSLCQASGHDIRSSINTLQFASMRCKKETEYVSMNSSSSASSMSRILNSMIVNGVKDDHRDIFTVWKDIFSSKNSRRTQKSAEMMNEINDEQKNVSVIIHPQKMSSLIF